MANICVEWLNRLIKAHKTDSRAGIHARRYPNQSPEWDYDNPFSKAAWENRHLIQVPFSHLPFGSHMEHCERTALRTGKPHFAFGAYGDLYEFRPHALFVVGAGRKC